MSKVLMFLLLIMITDPIEIARINKIKKEAEKAYNSGDYQLAASKYQLLSDSMGVDEDEILLNLGHSYYHLNDTSQAKNSYSSLATSDDKLIRSTALQQLGVIAKGQQGL